MRSLLLSILLLGLILVIPPTAGTQSAAEKVYRIPQGGTAAKEATSSNIVKFNRLSVKDPGVGNIEAVGLLVPAGWNVEGGIRWFPDQFILAFLLMKITDPQRVRP